MSVISQRTVRFLVLLVWLFTITTSTAQTFSFFKTGDGEASKFPKHEVRAVWLTTIGGLDWPRSYEMCIRDRFVCSRRGVGCPTATRTY